MEKFTYTSLMGVTVLSATMTNFIYRRHAHEEYALGVTLRGRQQYRLDGRTCVSTRRDVMLFCPEQAHDGCSGDREGIDYVMLYVPRPLFSEITGRRDVLMFAEPIIHDPVVASGILAFARSVVTDRNDALVHNILFDTINAVARERIQPVSGRRDAHLLKAVDIMRANVDGVLRLDDISQELGLSKYHFIRMFKAQMGMSPYQFFLNCKTEKAKRMIESGRDLYDIVLQCGFYDLSHLNRHFKSVYGITAFRFAGMRGKALTNGLADIM